MVSVVIHCNMHLANQTETAGWLQDGFRKHGIRAEITPDRYKNADVHVVQGPWYAFNQWLGQPNVLWLDRCFYGHPRWDISLGWLMPDGSRDFRNQDKAEGKGAVPELRPQKHTKRTAFVFGDYGRDPEDEIVLARREYDAVFFRSHPQDKRCCRLMEPALSLADIWEQADAAVGHSSTVLVEAAINGLHVHSTDPRHVVNGIEDRQDWLNRLSWCQWNHEELKNGDFWEHLN